MEREVTNKEIAQGDQDLIVAVVAQGQDLLTLHLDQEVEKERSIEEAIREEVLVDQVDLKALQEIDIVEVKVIVEVEARVEEDQEDHHLDQNLILEKGQRVQLKRAKVKVKKIVRMKDKME